MTWDADDGARKEVQRTAFAGSRRDIVQNDLKAYLGSDSSEEENDTMYSNAPYNADMNRTMQTNLTTSRLKVSKKYTKRQRMRVG